MQTQNKSIITLRKGMNSWDWFSIFYACITAICLMKLYSFVGYLDTTLAPIMTLQVFLIAFGLLIIMENLSDQ